MDNEDYNHGMEDYRGHMRNMEKEMFKIDVSRGGAMALDYNEFIDIFGYPSDEDMFDLCQAYIKVYMKQGDDSCIPYVVDMYGKKWVEEFLKYNERIEEYELCSLFKEHLDIYQKELQTSY